MHLDTVSVNCNNDIGFKIPGITRESYVQKVSTFENQFPVDNPGISGPGYHKYSHSRSGSTATSHASLTSGFTTLYT